MAERAFTITYPDSNTHSVVKYAATGLTQASLDTTPGIGSVQFADRSVQVIGTFGAAGNLRIEGSIDGGTTWAVLTDPQGNALDFTAAKIEAITELVELVRARVTAGDGTTSLSVYFIMRRATPPRS